MQKYFALKNKDNNIRIHSSSGGLFQEIAKLFLENNGVVYGAVYDDNNNVVHARITDANDVSLLGGSKYTKSDFLKCINLIKNDLKLNIKVLFSGTPCQIETVKKNVGNNDLIYYIDVVCHGTPQVKYFNEYKNYLEKKYKSMHCSKNSHET